MTSFKCIERSFYFKNGWQVVFSKNEWKLDCFSLVTKPSIFPCDKAERYQNETLAQELLQEKFKENLFSSGKSDCENGCSFETEFDSSSKSIEVTWRDIIPED